MRLPLCLPPLALLLATSCSPEPPGLQDGGPGQRDAGHVADAGPTPPAVGDLGGACFGNGACNGTLVCDDVTQTCTAETANEGEEGGPCYGNGSCDGALACNDSDICEQPGGPQEGDEGGPCYGNGSCNGSLVCNDSDICQSSSPPDAGPDEDPPFVEIEVFPTTIDEGSFTILSWGSLDADSCAIDQGVGVVAISGQLQVTPTSTTTYTLTCTNQYGSSNAATTVTVNPAVKVVVFTANGESPSTTIDQGESVTLAWTTDAATGCSIDQGVGTVSMNGTTTASPAVDTTYTISCTGLGGPAVASVQVIVDPAVSITSFTGDGDSGETTIDSGDTVILAWAVANADGCELDDGAGAIVVPASGTRSLQPTTDITYTLTCTGVGGPVSADVIVYVNPPVGILGLSANPDNIDFGQFSLLEWESESASSCAIDQGVGAVQLTGSTQVTPTVTTTYTLTCEGVQGPAEEEVTVSVNPPVIIGSFTVTDDTPDFLASVTLSWTTSNADSCSIDHGVGTVAANGSTAVVVDEALPGAQLTYTLTCEGVAGPVTDTVTLSVNNNIHVGNITLCGPNAEGACTPSGTAQNLSDANTVQGDVVLNGLAATSYSYPKLVTVTGKLQFVDVAPLPSIISQISFANLVSVGNNFSVFWSCLSAGGSGRVTSWSAPRLETIGGRLSWSCGAIEAIDASSLTSVDSIVAQVNNNFGTDGNTATVICIEPNFASLESITTDLTIDITNVRDLATAFPALTTIGDDLFINQTVQSQSACNSWASGIAVTDANSVSCNTTKTCE